MDSIITWQSALTASWGRVWLSFLGLLPTVIGAIIIFAIGLLLAFWVKRLVVEVLKIVKLDKVSKSSGIDEYLLKADLKKDLPDLVGTFVEWLIILVFFLAAVDILGLNVVSTVLVNVLGFVPNVIAAAFILAAGYIIAGVVDGMVRGALTSVDHKASKPVGKMAHWTILVVTFFAAIDQLQIAQGLIATFFQGLTYTIVLVVGLSVGLGAKDLVAKILDDWYEKMRK